MENALSAGSGAVTALSAPAAPIFNSTIGFMSNKIGSAMQIPLPDNQKNSPGVAWGNRLAGDVSNAINLGGAVAGFAEAPKPSLSLSKSASDIVSSRVAELTKLENNNAPVRNATAKAATRGVDSKSLLAQTDLLHNAVDNTGTIRTQGAIQELSDFLKPHEQVISRNLTREGVSIPLSTVERAMNATIDKSSLEGAALDTAYAKVESEMKGLSRRADANGNIPLAKLQDAKINKYSTLNYTDPAAKIADKAIARTYKGLIEDNTKSVDVKSLNKELAAHYSVMNLLEKLDGRKVDGGKLGKYFAQTVGAVAGSHFGPLGTIAGAELAGRIKGAAMSQKLSGKTGAALEPSATMAKATQQSKQPRLMLPPAREGVPKVQNNVPIRLNSGALPNEAAAQQIAPRSTYNPKNKSYYTAGKMGGDPLKVEPYSNSLGNRQSAQPATTNASKTAIPETITPDAASTIDRHFHSAEQVLNEMAPEHMAKLGGFPALLDTVRNDIALSMEKANMPNFAKWLKELDLKAFSSLDEFKKAVIEYLKNIQPGLSTKNVLPKGVRVPENLAKTLSPGDFLTIQKHINAQLSHSLPEQLAIADKFETTMERLGLANKFDHDAGLDNYLADVVEHYNAQGTTGGLVEGKRTSLPGEQDRKVNGQFDRMKFNKMLDQLNQ